MQRQRHSRTLSWSLVQARCGSAGLSLTVLSDLGNKALSPPGSFMVATPQLPRFKGLLFLPPFRNTPPPPPARKGFSV